jgi:hypothetical protein
VEPGLKSVVDVLDAIVDASAEMQRLRRRLGLRTDVNQVTTAHGFRTGPAFDFYVSAEMSNGEGLDWGFDARFTDTEWLIESGVTRSHAKGQDEVRRLPDRFAVSADELASELRSAVAMLVEVWTESDVMFPGEGYGT